MGKETELDMTNMTRDHDQRFRKAAKYCHGRILDIGCGNINWHLKGTEIVGFDRTPAEKITNHRLYDRIVTDDVKNLGKHFEPGYFDCITVLELLEHIEDHIKFLRDCDRILKRGGIIVISTPSPYYYKPLLGSLLFKKGKAVERNHVNCYLPRILNMIMDGLGYDVVDVTSARGRFYMPLISYSYLYVHRKR